MDSSGHRSRYHELSLQLQSLEDSRAVILAQLADLDARIRLVQAERAAVVPLNTLPDDVMHLILEEACTHPFARCKSGDSYAKDPAITMSHVSRRWRQLALSTPKIWKCIHVTVPGPSFYDNIVKLFLSRSAELPLSIILVCLDENLRSIDAVHQRLQLHRAGLVRRCWTLLCTASQRWVSCTLLCNEHPVVDFVQEQLVNLQFPNLQILHVYFQSCPAWDVSLDPRWSSPSLVDVGVFNVQIPTLYPLLQNVVKLTMHEQPLDVHFLARVSDASPRLAELALRDVTFNTEDDLSDPDFVLAFPRLRRLTMIDSDIDDILRLLEAPQLESLWIQSSDPESYLRGCAPIRASTLTELHCVGYACDRVRELFSPTVTTLEITDIAIHDYLELLMPVRGDQALPLLHSLTVSYNSLDDFTSQLLLELIKARAENNSPLRTVRICAPGVPSPPPLLPKFKAHNVDIETKSPEEPFSLFTNVNPSRLYWHDKPDDGDSGDLEAH
ncbi:hypothetical protein BDY19DRAFT_159309 [Irpex rosettiformis]|uniref:Uncharacterized protein n=1 Tax=Irpex rosettiformis TaxID=378272 RepID=A0ACB8U3Q8_9APHY|nr:hypothetical protein BDY19DRAFT_159309 [Irpex rosettiformis]